jgi:hypothetical protein
MYRRRYLDFKIQKCKMNFLYTRILKSKCVKILKFHFDIIEVQTIFGMRPKLGGQKEAQFHWVYYPLNKTGLN